MSFNIGKGSKYDTRATIFRPETKTTANNKTIVQANLSTGKKQQDGTYKNSSWNASFVGAAATKFVSLGLAEKSVIEITSAEVENIYVKEKEKSYLRVTVYDFIIPEGSAGSGSGSGSTSTPASSGSDGFMNIPDGIDEELPFN